MKNLGNILGDLSKSSSIFKSNGKNRPLKTNHQGQIIESPVRKGSLSLRQAALNFRPFNKKDTHRFLLAAERYEKITKKKGKRIGALGQTGILVLRELLRLIDFKTGRLDPSIKTLAKRINIAPKTVCAALKRLREHGFINWVRRYEVTNAERKFSLPQLKQATNAYFLELPEIAKNILGKMFAAPPLPEDFEHEKQMKEQKITEQLKSLTFKERLKTEMADCKLRRILEKFDQAADAKFTQEKIAKNPI